MISKLKFYLFFVLFLGCINPNTIIGPVVTGVIYWINGEAHQYYNEDPEILYRATKKSLKDLELLIIKDEKKSKLKEFHAYLLAGDNNRFAIKIDQADKNISKISIRINYIGDKEFAELIYEKIKTNIPIILFDKDGNPVKNN